MRLAIQMRAALPQRVRTMLSRVRDLSGLTAYCSNRVAELVRGHLDAEAGRRHATARRLGAEPTGFLADAASSTIAAPEPRAVVVRVDSPGVRRAYHDVEIRPKNGSRHLTIPINRLAYGQRVSSVARAVGEKWFVIQSGGRLLLASKDPVQKHLLPLYILKRSVRQAQDPTLMPSEAEISRRLVSSAAEYIRRHVARLARGAS